MSASQIEVRGVGPAASPCCCSCLCPCVDGLVLCPQATVISLASGRSVLDCVTPAHYRSPGKSWADMMGAMVQAMPKSIRQNFMVASEAGGQVRHCSLQSSVPATCPPTQGSCRSTHS